MIFLESEVEPIRDADEAVDAWRRIYSDCDEPRAARERCRRLALGMILLEEIREAVEVRAVEQLPPVRGYLSKVTRLAERARITPLQILAETDPEVAFFLVRHPHAIQALLAEEESDAVEELDWDTPVMQEHPRILLRKMKRIAPLMLERVGIGREHTEPFLTYLHQASIVDRLRRAESARTELREILARFWCEKCSGTEQDVRANLTRQVMDNIIWQVAVAVRRAASEDTNDRDRLQKVALALQKQLGGSREPERPEHTVTHALLSSTGRDEATTIRLRQEIVRALPFPEE